MPLMPRKEPKAGTRRSGQGDAAGPLQKPIVKTWDPPRPTFPGVQSHGGSPSMAADTNASLRMSYHHGDDDSYQGGDDVLWPRETEDEEEGEAGCLRPGLCRAPRGEFVGEQLLRQFVRVAMLSEGGVIDEDEDEMEEPEVDEFASIGGGAIAGYVEPLGKKPPKVGSGKRKKKGHETKGWKVTHG